MVAVSSSLLMLACYKLCIKNYVLTNLPRCCGVQDPSWSEIRHFVKFLNLQLKSCEESVFTDSTLVGDVMAGLKGFVVKFMMRMSKVRTLLDNT